jgi:hypothetical protein
MRRLIYFLCLILLFLLPAGCITENVYIDSTPAAARTQAFNVAQTFQNSQRSTMTASVRQTATAQKLQQASLTAEKQQATQAAKAWALTQTIEIAQYTSTAASQQTEDALNVTRTGLALAETSIQITHQAQGQQLDNQRQGMLNTILGWVWFLVVISFIAIILWGFMQLLRASMARRRLPEAPASVMVWDHNGYLLFENPAPQIVVTNFSRPVLQVPPDVHDLAAREASAASMQETRRLRKRPEIPAVASWKRVCDEWQGGSLPLGMSAEGMLTIHPHSNPHLLIAGTAGIGKTRFAMRPLAAAALADGWQVVIFNRKVADYALFCEYPNVNLISLGVNPGADAIRYLSRINVEICRRIDILERLQTRSWLEVGKGAHRTLVMMDDFYEVMNDKTRLEDQKKLWRLARSVAADGHRAGIHLIISMRDPSYTDLDLRIRRYMTPVSFQVRGAHISRVILNAAGAEALLPRQFMAILDENLVFGFAFAPDDAGIVHLLDSRPMTPHKSPAWLLDP